ncbi:hypothetical protein NX722_25825 [Endozoicomonas gorgoniicola]|uniref:Pilus assembly protein PilB n=1 Tax=Endozoicomonas gorgoniicola TaxID=1234144 RepID=A0ABT3N2X7_9GAMM|nr:hypothetical protein [Endozoicomonas gorgoniicola]MCW7555985.1 hypothetical protein [Endozoicomonas gorgoniicola]
MDNVNRAEAYHKSRLGRILLKRGYVSEAQLKKATELQKQTGQRLGEVLLEMKDISLFQLRRALSNQTRIRFASSLAIALLQPLQSLAGLQGEDDSDEAIQGTDQLTRLIAPLINSLTTADGFQALEYDPYDARAEIRADGSIRLRIPCSLGELRFEHLRIRASVTQEYEELTIADVDLSKAKFSVRAVRK